MKKLLIIAVAALLTTSGALSQTKEVDAVKKKLEKNDATIADPKKAEIAASWIDRANIFVDMSIIYTSKLIPGFSFDNILPMVGAPSSQEEVTYKDVTYTANDYPNVTIYTAGEGKAVAFWIVKKDIIDSPLEKAYDALVKAKALAVKEFVGQGKGVVASGRLQAQYQTDGMAYYTMGESAKAAKYFYKSYETGELMGAFDTVYLYYSGVANFEAEQYKDAITAFDKVLASGMDQEGLLYYYVAACYSKLGEVQKGIEVLEKGFDNYPQNAAILGELINSYLAAKQEPTKIIDKIQAAQKLDPQNTSLYLVESGIYNDMGQSEKAYLALEKAIAVDSNFFSAYYNYAIRKILEAQDLREKADAVDVNDNKGYNALMEQIIALQTQAIEKLEKAHKVDPKNFDAVDLLKQLYFARRDTQPEKYEYFEKLAKELEPAQ